MKGTKLKTTLSFFIYTINNLSVSFQDACVSFRAYAP